MDIALMWFRRDLRLDDNNALYQALTSGYKVLPIFIFDSDILDLLEDKDDSRVHFIHSTISSLKKELNALGTDLQVYHGKPLQVIKKLVQNHSITAIYHNRDYEPYAIHRDLAIDAYCKQENIAFKGYKDQVIFESTEVRKDDGGPYVVFTPYSRKWIQKLNSPGDLTKSSHLQLIPSQKHFHNFIKIEPSASLTLNDIGFVESSILFPSKNISRDLITEYHKSRDFPALKGTSRLGVHFRFGTISIREKTRKAISLNKTYLNELIWRDFYSMILQEFPRVAKESFRLKYESIEWRNDEQAFIAWCRGMTGYPLVDAGMRELNTTGFMHNRVRMVVASFLTKHLLIDWRWGEAYFARKLLDFDLASNNGGWQWAAGCGTDAAPYFRIFNPESQRKKFDPNNVYIKNYIPEFGTTDYPQPIVDHKFAQERCLAVYKAALSNF